MYKLKKKDNITFLQEDHRRRNPKTICCCCHSSLTHSSRRDIRCVEFNLTRLLTLQLYIHRITLKEQSQFEAHDHAFQYINP